MSARTRGASSIIGFVALLMGCVGDKGVAPAVRPAATALGAISITPLNAVMAVGDTFSYQVQGRTLDGTPVTALDSVQYLLLNRVDTLRVRIDSVGHLTAIGASPTGNPVRIQIIAYKNGLARANMSVVTVAATAFANATLSIQPVPPDSATIAMGARKNVSARIRSTSGAQLTNVKVLFEYTPGDSGVLACFVPPLIGTATLTQNQLQAGTCANDGQATPVLGQISARKAGTIWLHANATVFGVPLRDSVLYRIVNPFQATVSLAPGRLGVVNRIGASVAISPGGVVSFSHSFDPSFGVSIGFVFDNPSAATKATPASTVGDSTGNITPLAAYETSTRRFLTPGVYTWTATVTGGIAPYTGTTTRGTIRVE